MRLFAAAIALVLGAGIALTAEFTGTLKKIDTEKKEITVEVTEGEKTKTMVFKYTADPEVNVRIARKGAEPANNLTKLNEGLGSAKRPVRVTIDADGEVVKKITSARRKKADE